MLAILAPGQGAQTPGMLHPWLDLPGVTERLRWFSAATGLDLVELGTEAPADTIKDTAVAQPLIVATGDPDAVVAHLEGLGLTPANRNGAGQIVAAGDLAALARLTEEPPAGARVRTLAVAGAFHTHFMASARDTLAAVAPGVVTGAPRLGQVSNADGAVITDGAEVLARLVSQVANPVRWDLCLATLRELGVKAVIELPPAGTLAGIARRELPGVRILAVKSPDDLVAARELIAEHVGAEQPSVVIPAPARELEPATAHAGEA